MPDSSYQLKIGGKTHFLNFFRRIFKIRPFEKLLVKVIQGLPPESLWVRLMPPNYLYRKNSRREVERNGIKYSLDISDYVEHAVYFGYRDRALETLIRLAERKKLIIDIGSNIGVVLLNWARVSPNCDIIGFEPDTQNYFKAQKNLQMNRFDNVQLIKKGLGEESAAVKLFKVNEANKGMNRIIRDEQLEEDYAFDEIEIIKFDDFVTENSLENIDLIKIDVEGYELKVLQGAEYSLKRFAPTLFIELDDNNLLAQNDSAQSLVLFLEKLDYKIYRADKNLIVKSDDDFTQCHFDIICEITK